MWRNSDFRWKYCSFRREYNAFPEKNRCLLFFFYNINFWRWNHWWDKDLLFTQEWHNFRWDKVEVDSWFQTQKKIEWNGINYLGKKFQVIFDMLSIKYFHIGFLEYNLITLYSCHKSHYCLGWGFHFQVKKSFLKVKTKKYTFFQTQSFLDKKNFTCGFLMKKLVGAQINKIVQKM